MWLAVVCWVVVVRGWLQARSVPNIALKSAETESVGPAVEHQWSSLTQELLGLGNGYGAAQCTPPDKAYLLDLSNELAEANTRFKLSGRLQGALKATMLKQEPLTNATLMDKLDQSLSLLQRVCLLEAEGTNGTTSRVRQRAKSNSEYPIWADDDPDTLKLQIIQFTFTELAKQFSTESYHRLISVVMGEGSYARFQQGLAKLGSQVPHCDAGDHDIVASEPATVPFPGGPFRLNFNFNLAQWLTQELMQVAQQTQQGVGTSADPVGQMMSMMAVMSVISIIETVVGIIIDIVPPMIPPPFWILWAFPCLPMLTGKNCLWSVLYPISIADFMLASTTDAIMDGIIGSFPAKYAMKVGKTSDAAYRVCAMSYLGMNCASIFPMCWLPIGVMEAMSFPMCFLHCILTLVACPGFWIDDIIGPCMSISVPPLCSFSLFINLNAVPPQYVTYSEAHPYPQECPAYDPAFDMASTGPAKPGEVGGVGGTGIAGALTNPDFDDIQFEESKSLVGDISDWENVVVPQQFVCDCSAPCRLVAGNVPKGDCIPQSCVEYCASQHPQMVPITTSSSTTPTPRPEISKEFWNRELAFQDKQTSKNKNPNLGHIYPVH